MTEQQYVVVRNMNRTAATFNEHSGRSRTLAPVSQKDDSIKILLADNDIGSALKYVGLKDAGFSVILSEGLQGAIENMHPVKKMFIETGSFMSPEVKQRVEFLREEAANKLVEERSSKGRLARAKAELSINEKKGLTAPLIKSTGDVTRQAKALGGAIVEENPEVNEAIESLNVGEEISAESLGKIGIADLKGMAVEMKIEFRPGISKQGLINAILAEVTKK